MKEQALDFRSTPRIHRHAKSISSSCFEGSIEELFTRYLHFRAMYELIRKVATEQELEPLLSKVLDKLIDLLHAERGLILLFDDSGDIAFQKGRNLNHSDINNPAFEASWKIIEKARRDNKSIYLRSAYDHPNFQSNSVLRLKILSVICVPIRHKNHVIGILYLDNRQIKDLFCKEQGTVAEKSMEIISPYLHSCLHTRQLQLQVQTMQDNLKNGSTFPEIIGHDPKLQKVLELVRQVADSTATVLIEGASGTGKELIARAIHQLSGRRMKRFVALNCGALTETLLESELFGHTKGSFTGAIANKKGWFETADGGTIFFDEISEMSSALQVKLLRVLQTGEFTPVGDDTEKQCDVRIIAATNKRLLDLVQKGDFRDDLYYRLNIITISLPLLRERPKDILPLAMHFIRKHQDKGKKTLGISKRAQNILQEYAYPGNIRELENAIQRALLLCNGPEIKPEHLPPEMQQAELSIENVGSFASEKRKIVEKFEKDYILNALNRTRGIVSHAAKLAQMDAKNFYQKMNKYGINPAPSKR